MGYTRHAQEKEKEKEKPSATNDNYEAIKKLAQGIDNNTYQ